MIITLRENLPIWVYCGRVNTKKPPVWNIANVLTILRLALVPAFVWAFWEPTVSGHWWAAGIFAFAAATDKLDGHLARSRGLITDFGKLADSIADKALVGAALIMLSMHDYLPWWITIVMLARELFITLMRMYMTKHEVMAAGKGGKIKMVLQSFFIMGFLIPWDTFLPDTLATIMFYATWVLVVLALIVSIGSAIQYVRDAIRIKNGH